jgi:integrase
MRKIKPRDNNGTIQLKVVVNGNVFRFSPIPHGRFNNPRDLEAAKTIALRMSTDLATGRFDTTLASYRITENAPKLRVKRIPKKLTELWDMWVQSLDLQEEVRADHYRTIGRQIAKASPGLLEVGWFKDCKLAPSTFNTRRGFLARCLGWAVHQGFIEANPWLSVRPRKVIRKLIKPFTPGELERILWGFQRICPHYYPIVAFLAATGCRVSEAFAMTWENIDFDKGTLVICESLAVRRSGNCYERYRKETKNGIIRFLDLPEPLRKILEPWRLSSGPVFKSQKGQPVAYNTLWHGWREVLKAQGVPYRTPHVLRHTCLSMAIEQGTSLVGVAYLAGHSDLTMVTRTYGHMINRPSLPRVL